MLFFCPLNQINNPIPTNLADQRAAIAEDGAREIQGLCVDAPTPSIASDTVTSYLLDCIRSGRPGYAPTVTMEDRDGVPVATIIDGAPLPTPAERAAVHALSERAKRAKPQDAKPRDVESLPVQPDDGLSAMLSAPPMG
jgi:hypothetical protein